MTIEIPSRYDAYIDGEQYEGNDSFMVDDPATNEPITTVTETGPEGVDVAMAAAKEALADWREMDPETRGHVLREIANSLRAEQERLARLETREVGRPLRESMSLIADAASYFDYYAGITDKIEGDTIPVPGNRLNYTVREPLGVTGHIVPWNAAMILGARSMAPALACGNTVVAKPSPEAPLSLLEFGRLATEAGVPEGVVNIVPGDGPNTGAALTNHDHLDGVVFTGSRATGKQVMKAAAENVIPAELELGGKNPGIIFPDADFEQVVEDLQKVYINTGQVCFVPSRLFIHKDVYDEVLEEVVSRIEGMTVGPGIDDPDMGPLISPEARNRVADYVDQAVADGARVLTGGGIPRGEGNFYAPTIVDGIDDDAPISCDEVFGPVVATYEFSSEKEVIRRANDTEFGLYAALYTATLDRAHRIAHKLEVGSVVVNEYPATFPQAPFGGYKESGVGREKGQQAVEHYTQLKNVTVSLGDTPGAVFEK